MAVYYKNSCSICHLLKLFLVLKNKNLELKKKNLIKLI